MAKIITDHELYEAVGRLMGLKGHCDAIQDNLRYEEFLVELAQVVCNYSGGVHGGIGILDGDDGEYTVAIHPDERLPSDGGVWRHYDTDVSFENGEER